MAPPPPTPRAPPPTPMSPKYTSSSSSSSSTASSSNPSYTPQEYSYFSPQTPLSGSAPTSPYVQALHSSSPISSVPSHSHPSLYSNTPDPSRPIITGFVTSRGSTSSSSSSNMATAMAMHSQPATHYSHHGHGHQTAAYHRLNPHQQYQHHHTHPPPPASDVLQQFALHIPAPPTLSMPSKMSSRQPSLSGGGGSTSNTSSPTTASTPQLQSQHQYQSQPHAPEMTCRTESSQHALSVLLPRSIAPEMVTISANKGDRLRVVAQAWHGQDESHYEWQISFPPYDVDLGKVQAKFDPDGCLTIRVPRRVRMGR